MKVHALASLPQYARHIRAVWRHLPLELRGDFLLGNQAVGNRHHRRDVFMVGAGPEILRAAQRQVYVEHGAGQAYGGDPRTAGSVGYHGAVHDKRVCWYLSPRPDVAESWGRPAFVAGCPALDDLPLRPLAITLDVGVVLQPIAVIAFHWDAARLCPEAGTARPHYAHRMRDIVQHLRSQGFEVVGHWHPREPTLRRWWRELGVVTCAHVDEALAYAHLWIGDNSSAMYEAAALGRPVIVLNAPWYRRDVEHGLRFWSHPPGWQVDGPDELLALDIGAYVREDWSENLRVSSASYAYGGVRPGGAGAAAASWIVEQLAARN